MKKDYTQKMQFKRKRLGRTDYKNRLVLLKAGQPRLVVRKFNKNLLAQVVEYHPDGDKVLASFHSRSLLKNYGWKVSRSNLPTGYLVGLGLSKKAQQKGVKTAVLDLGLYSIEKGTVFFSVVKGVIDGGIKVPCDPKMFPDDKRISGKHIVDYALIAKEKIKKYDPNLLLSEFEKIKEKIMKQ